MLRVIVCRVWFHPNARRAGVIVCWAWLCRTSVVQAWVRAGVVPPNARRAGWFRAGVVRVSWRHAHDGGQPAEPIVAADRYAREIVRFLTPLLRRARGR